MFKLRVKSGSDILVVRLRSSPQDGTPQGPTVNVNGISLKFAVEMWLRLQCITQKCNDQKLSMLYLYNFYKNNFPFGI